MTRQKTVQFVGFALLAVVGLLMAMLVTISVNSPARVFLVEASTTGATLTFKGAGTSWSLETPVICTPKATVDRGADFVWSACDPRRFDATAEDSETIQWNDGSQVVLEGMTNGGLAVVVVSHATLAKGTRIVLTKHAWQKTGALTLSGTVEIGGQMGAGETNYLLSGTFEAREQAWFSASTEEVKSGTLRRGETVRIVTIASTGGGVSDAPVFAQITPGEDETLQINMVAEPGWTALAIGYFGGREPSLIAPTWVDRALSSPFFIAVAGILTSTLAGGQLLLSVLQIRRPDEESPPESGESSGDSAGKTVLPESRRRQARKQTRSVSGKVPR